MGGVSSHPETLDELPSAQTIQGIILKESETVKQWNERYAVLARRTLKYWTNEADKSAGLEPRATILLANTRVCSFTDTDHPEGTILIETPTSDKKRLAAQLGQSRIFIQSPSRDLASDWLRKLRIASREPWCADDAAKGCSQCEAAFDGALSRRHHCRRCGEVFCAACTPQQQAMKDFGYDTPVRVCMSCYGIQGPLLPVEERTRRKEAEGAAAEDQRLASKLAEVARSKRSAAAEADDRRARLKQQFGVKA